MDRKLIINNVLRENTVLGERVYEIDSDANLMDLGMDSMQMMRVIVSLESAFKFEFKDEDLLMVNFSTINSINNSLETILSNRGD